MSEGKASEAAAQGTLTEPKYPHPRILAIDCPLEDSMALHRAGYHVQTWTFGNRVKVERSASYVPLKAMKAPPNFTEQEIVIVDCEAEEASEGELGEPAPDTVWPWQQANRGIVDPRPWSMMHVREAFDRILAHGGVFICFIDHKQTIDYIGAKSYNGKPFDEGPAPLTTWNFLSSLADVSSTLDGGEELRPTSLGEHLPGLQKAFADSSFTCTIDPPHYLEDRWETFATNKFGQTVSACYRVGADKGGIVFLLPRVKQRLPLLKYLLGELLPRISPGLFPDVLSGSWVRQHPYELREVLSIEDEIERVKEEASTRVKELEDGIAQERNEKSYLPELLTTSGDELVAAVKSTFEMLGFKQVIDADAEKDDKTALREDLQVLDRSPALIIEVKGISGLPKEEHALQVTKYLAPRMKEWERQDVQGLAVINHQQGLPGLDRERANVFQKDVVTNAETLEFGLLTTWELFRLARGYLRHGWKPEYVLDLFYGHGVIHAVPSHYEFVGTVNQFFEEPEALTIDLEAPIRVGDTLAYELPVEFEEQSVGSLRLDDAVVDKAEAGAEIGVKTKLSKEQARKGLRVFKVQSGHEANDG